MNKARLGLPLEFMGKLRAGPAWTRQNRNVKYQNIVVYMSLPGMLYL